MSRVDDLRGFIGSRVFPGETREVVLRTFEEALVEVRKERGGAVESVRILCDASPAEYLGKMLAALVLEHPIFCFNPRWGETELLEARAAVAAALCAGAGGDAGDGAVAAGEAEGGGASRPSIYIATGGSGGRVRFVRHTPQTLFAAARAQNAMLAERTRDAGGGGTGGVEKEVVHSCSPLPPWHVSGLMPLFRALCGGGMLWLCDGKFDAGEALPEVPLAPGSGTVSETGGDTRPALVLSVVPTQLFRILERAEGAAWLRRFGCVLAGGAALPPELAERARREQIPLGVGYGMTETAAFVALQTPADFLSAAPGEPPQGRVLPHARVEILGDDGVPLPAGRAGRVAIEADSLAPDLDVGRGGDGGGGGFGSECGADAPRSQRGGRDVLRVRRRRFVTQDEGMLCPETGRLRILGRLDRYVVTGGEKVDPRRVEAAILECPLAAAALVVGEPDPEWGARVTALVELWGGYAACDWRATLAGFVRRKLAPFCVPKRWVQVPRLPFDEKGKLDRAELARLLA